MNVFRKNNTLPASIRSKRTPCAAWPRTHCRRPKRKNQLSDSRRRFLKAGVLAAMFAAVPLKNVLGHGWNADEYRYLIQDDPLANYTKATFEYYLNSIFRLRSGYTTVDVTLTKVDDLAAARGGECFSLLFRGGGTALPQGTYRIEHAALGKFALFLVPTGTDDNGAQGYLATINRLSYSDAKPGPKRAWVNQMEDSSPANTAPAKSTPPQSPAPAITKPEAKPAPVRKVKKPSWKRTDEDELDEGLIN